MTRERAFNHVLTAITRAFDRVAQLCDRVKASDTDTIHCTRIAFKRFRYMTEALAPLLPAVTDHHRQAMARLSIHDGRHPGRGSVARDVGQISGARGDQDGGGGSVAQ